MLLPKFDLATAAPFGLRWRYGLPPVRPVADHRIDVLMLRAPFVGPVRNALPIALVIQIEDESRRMRDRLVDRGSPRHELEARLADNEREIELGREVADLTLVNDDSITRLADRLLAGAAPLADRVR